MAKKRLFITGINGRIGSILRQGLAETYEIFGLDRQGPFSPAVTVADIRDYDQVAIALRKAAPVDFLVHLAADPDETGAWDSILPTNIVGTRNVFEAAREGAVRRIVFASSNHVTGAYEGCLPDRHPPDKKPISVRDPVRPDGYYGVSKVFGEALASYFHSCWGMEVICLRIGAVLKDDDPGTDSRLTKVWLSHRDLLQLVQAGLEAGVGFGIYYGVSDNREAFWDISNARDELGYHPLDDASGG